MPEHEATHMALKDIVNNTRLQPPNLGVSGMVAHATFHGGVQYVTEEDRILLPVCYLPRHSRITQIYLKQEGNPSPNPGNTRCLPQGINNCPQQQWLVYLLQIIITLFLRSGPYAGRGRLILLALITIGASHMLEKMKRVSLTKKKDNMCQMETYRSTYLTLRRTRFGRRRLRKNFPPISLNSLRALARIQKEFHNISPLKQQPQGDTSKTANQQQQPQSNQGGGAHSKNSDRGQSDNRKRKRRSSSNDHYRSANKTDSKNAQQLNLEAATLKLKVGLINIAGLTPEKWENMKEYILQIKDIEIFVITETHMNNTETPGYILQDGYTLYSTLGKKQKGKSNVYNGGIALLVKTDTYEVKTNILLQDIHQITTWTLTAPYMTNPFHITGAYCSPAVGKPAITGLKWEIKPRKPMRGIEIRNNPALISKIQQNTEISHNDLINCYPMALTTKHFVKIGNIYMPRLHRIL